MPISRQRKQRGEIKDEKEKFAWTAVHNLGLLDSTLISRKTNSCIPPVPEGETVGGEVVLNDVAPLLLLSVVHHHHPARHNDVRAIHYCACVI